MEPQNGEMQQGTPLSVLRSLESAGYTKQFVCRNGKVVQAESGAEFDPSAMTIKGVYRFEGASDPDNMSILYALETPDHVKGLLTDAFGAYGDPEVGRCMDAATYKKDSR